jgi:hypothetical protein
MNIKEFKEYVAQIPSELDEYPLVVREATFLNTEEAESAAAELGIENNGMLYSALDKPVTACFVDENTKELCILDEPSYVVLSTVINAGKLASEAAAVVADESNDSDSAE